MAEPLDWGALPRTSLGTFDRHQVPDRPGVYIVYRDGQPVFVGKAANLASAIAHALSAVFASPAPPLRCLAADFLGIASATAVRTGRYRPTPEDIPRITGWIRDCDVAWWECESESEAVRLEALLKNEPDRIGRG